ncbi:MAG TPA: hypothetical protein VFY06_07000 [Verrucomicrobiae bacterium]|nr:hypothetical protein [Verrucomicrobiae bacterium]
MKTIATVNQLNDQLRPGLRDLARMCLLSACLLLGWMGINQAAKMFPGENRPDVSVTANPVPYDLDHSAEYRAAVLSYTAQNGMRDFPF